MLSGNQYFESLRFKWEITQYHRTSMETEISEYRWNISEHNNPHLMTMLAGHFDGMMYQIHTTQDICAQLINDILKLGLNHAELYLNVLVKNPSSRRYPDRHSKITEFKKLFRDVDLRITELYNSTEYLRSYMNYSKHRNLISPFKQFILTVPGVVLSSPYISSFEYNGNTYPLKDLVSTAQEEMRTTETGLEHVLSSLDKEVKRLGLL